MAGLLSALVRRDSGHEFVAYFASPEAAAPWHGLSGRLTTVPLALRGSIARLVAELPLRCLRDRADVLHVQYFAPPVSPVPFVPMVHDVSYAIHPDTFSRRDRARFKMGIPWTVRRARRILTVSEHSKGDIVARYGVLPEQVDVAYPGVDPVEFSPDPTPADAGVLAAHGIRPPYVLAVGNIQPRKNLVRLLGAYARVRQARPDLAHELVLVGKPALRHGLVEEAVRAGRLDGYVRHTGYVPRQDLPALYRQAEAFCYPSLYEGFGLPVLEAMACGTPVVTSRNSSLPEVAGGAALLADPTDESSIATALIEVLGSAAVRSKLSLAGPERARLFSWDATAGAVIASLEAAV